MTQPPSPAELKVGALRANTTVGPHASPAETKAPAAHAGWAHLTQTLAYTLPSALRRANHLRRALRTP